MRTLLASQYGQACDSFLACDCYGVDFAYGVKLLTADLNNSYRVAQLCYMQAEC